MKPFRFSCRAGGRAARAAAEWRDMAKRAESLGYSTITVSDHMGPGPFTFEGKHCRIKGLELRPRQHQRPHVPILIGGTGPKLLAIAANHADIIGFTRSVTRQDPADWTLDALAAKTARIRKLAGERDPELMLSPEAWEITDDRANAVATTAAAMKVSPAVVEQATFVLLGSVERVVEDLLRLRERTGISYVAVSGGKMEQFGPVVAKLAGH